MLITTEKFRKTWALGDIHGADKAFEQVLQLSGFDNENDLLLFTGDSVDGWPETRQVIERLMGIKNLVSIRGNHDDWLIQHCTGEMDDSYLWLTEGGQATLDSYPEGKVPDEHLKFLLSSVAYCEIASKEGEKPTKIITHGGFDWIEPIEKQNSAMFCWDRDLARYAHYVRKQNKNLSNVYEEIYIGHTPTISFNQFYIEPKPWAGVWNIDTGAAYTGRLTMIDINTKEFFQSDVVRKLYPTHPGRNGRSYDQDKNVS